MNFRNVALSIVLFGLFVSFVANAEQALLVEQIKGKCPSTATWLEQFDDHHSAAGYSEKSVTPTNALLRSQLLAAAAKDQAARNQINSEGQKYSQASLTHVLDIDADNLKLLRRVISQQGFPTRFEVGNDGAAAAFILAQHADTDRNLQIAVLADMTAPDADDQKPDQVAMLYDRVALASHRPQRYGSQLNLIDGKWVPTKPLEDPGSIDQRRAGVGLMPIDDYVCMMNAVQPNS